MLEGNPKVEWLATAVTEVDMAVEVEEVDTTTPVCH
jgi:hypothetical protein